LVPERIQVVGASGSGKTTLARELAERLEARHIELDALHNGPNWGEASTEELRAAVEPLLSEQRWIVDGAYLGRLGTLVIDRAELVLWLDPPLGRLLGRLLGRTARRLRTREALWHGNRETVRTVIGGPIRRHRELRRELPQLVPTEKLVRIRSDAELAEWLARLRPGMTAASAQ
jgi:adenylate kinase family enzyme